MVFRFELKYEQQGSGRWTRPGSGRGQSEDTRAAEVTLLQPSNTLTLRGSEWWVQYYEKVPAFNTHLEELVWQFCSFNFKFSWFWGLVWARRGETRIQVGNSTLFIENVKLIRFWKVWPLERLDRAGRAARRETRGRYVTLLHCCHAALTLARCYTSVTLHWHTVTRDPASGPRPGLTEISEWNQPEPGPGPQYNTLQLGYPGNGEIIQNNTIGPEYKEAWGEYKTSWTAHWDHSLLFVASSFLWLSILNKNKK